MVAIVPVDTLSHYLSKTGFPKFKKWFLTVEEFKPILIDITSLVETIENSTWYEDRLRKDSFNKIREIINTYIEKLVKYPPDIYFQKWIDSIQPYCFQGGYGYKIQYSGNYPHHWCVRPEHYEKVKKIPELVKLCAIISDKYVNLAEKAEVESWNN
jgi:hypothetical protein